MHGTYFLHRFFATRASFLQNLNIAQSACTFFSAIIHRNSTLSCRSDAFVAIDSNSRCVFLAQIFRDEGVAPTKRRLLRRLMISLPSCAHFILSDFAVFVGVYAIKAVQ